MRVENLIANIIRGDLDKVNSILKQLENDSRNNNEAYIDRIKRVINERIDGNRNIIHAAVFSCAPVSNKDVENTTTSGLTIPKPFERSWSNKGLSTAATGIPTTTTTTTTSIGNENTIEINAAINDHSYENRSMDTTDAIPTSFWPPLDMVLSDNNTKSKETIVWPPVKIDEKEKRQNSIKILQALLDSNALKDYINDLLTFKNAEGATPFMYAINIRAYNAALSILDTAMNIRKESTNIFYKIIYPQNSSPDNCPLYVLCCNDTCSFTWTGDNHITQDIFECKTCTLVGNLCCCTECARTCHKGHDCKIKTSSPTAYCDCWEKCKCKSLIAGDQEKRYELLCKLLTETNLLMHPNSRGEHLLLFLAQVVGRQIQEQRNYKRGNTVLRKNLATIDVEMPQHDLEPPKFSRRALDRILNDWQAVKEMILFNYKIKLTSEIYDETFYYDNQNGSIDLDKFIHCLIVKCPQEMLNTLVNTMCKELNNDPTNSETCVTVRRFIRSIARLFVLLNMETVPSPANIFNQTNLVNSSLKYRKTTATSSLLSSPPISKCEQIFKQFSKLCIEELSNIAQSLVTPILLGTAKPSMFKPASQEDRTDRQNYSNNNNNNTIVDELFNVEASTVQRHAYIPQSRTEPQTVPTFANMVAASQQQRRAPSIRRGGVLQQTDILNATSTVTAPPPPPPPSQPVPVVVPSIGEDTYSDQISENDDSESNTRDNYELHDEMELNLFAESDSDSDNSNNSIRDNASAAQRSAITAATVGTGSDPGGVYFSDNDSDVSSNEEDEDSDIRSDILNVDNDNSEMMQFNSEQPSDLYNRQIQWSVRRHAGDTVSSSSSSRIPASLSVPITSNATASNFTTTTTNASLYQDIHMRRATHAVPLNSITQPQTSSQATPVQVQQQSTNPIHHYSHAAAAAAATATIADHHESESVMSTNNNLARSFSVIMRIIRELLNTIYQKDDKLFDVQSFYSLIEIVNGRLEHTWQWLVNILDSTEAQLRFGCASNSLNIESSVAQYLKSIEDKAITSNTKTYDSNRRRTLSTFSGIHRTNTAVPPPVNTGMFLIYYFFIFRLKNPFILRPK
jgi:E3 ubiquitin-protein ligase EDD1